MTLDEFEKTLKEHYFVDGQGLNRINKKRRDAIENMLPKLLDIAHSAQLHCEFPTSYNLKTLNSSLDALKAFNPMNHENQK